MEQKSEREILRDIRNGQREAFEKIICGHYKDIYRFMVYLTNNSNFAEDLTQETFAAAWENIAGYKGRSGLKTWLHRIAYHKFIDAARKIQRHDKLMDGIKRYNNDESEVFNPFRQIVAKEQSQILYETIQKLRPAEQVAIVLHYIQHMSFRQMAKVLNKSVGTVKWRTSRALKQLRTFLDKKL